jgi:acetyl-CoA carboxylase biotin carboxylase subunit
VISTVLIANRGEIAVRVARTCREMGLRTVAVYSTADRHSAVVRLADRAVHIGPAPSRRSYLNIPAIIEAARLTGSDAIHPGYGFLSEDADFAEICEASGITFIGTPSAVMARLGNKSSARTVFAALGLPVLPGAVCGSDESAARTAADGVGYPLIIKASAGGGGRGMRIVWDRNEFPAAYRETRASADATFGSPEVYLERYVETARHVEVQILADRHGNVVHLGERDCSVQRRHQKLIEETPAPGLARSTATEMATAAASAAAAVGYVGAATFEFIVDEHGRPQFIEVNCRIQVEHPVTEMVTNVDLIREQIRIAAGEPLSLRQSDVHARGVSIECRVNAEDPERRFTPTPAVIAEFVPPGGAFTRVDTHVYPGFRVGADYDPLLAKVVVWAPDRDQAIARMQRALGEFQVSGNGLRTTVGFLGQVLAHPLFRDAKHTTRLVDGMLAD